MEKYYRRVVSAALKVAWGSAGFKVAGVTDGINSGLSGRMGNFVFYTMNCGR